MAEREVAYQSHAGPVASLFRPPSPLVIPLPGGARQITVTARWPVTNAQWDHLMAVLEAMRPGLVSGPGNEGPPQ
jgi:hypothetical protein